MHCVLDLFGAGTESTAKSLSWALLYMAKYPEVQGGPLRSYYLSTC